MKASIIVLVIACIIMAIGSRSIGLYFHSFDLGAAVFEIGEALLLGAYAIAFAIHSK